MEACKHFQSARTVLHLHGPMLHLCTHNLMFHEHNPPGIMRTRHNTAKAGITRTNSACILRLCSQHKVHHTDDFLQILWVSSVWGVAADTADRSALHTKQTVWLYTYTPKRTTGRKNVLNRAYQITHLRFYKHPIPSRTLNVNSQALFQMHAEIRPTVVTSSSQTKLDMDICFGAGLAAGSGLGLGAGLTGSRGSTGGAN